MTVTGVLFLAIQLKASPLASISCNIPHHLVNAFPDAKRIQETQEEKLVKSGAGSPRRDFLPLASVTKPRRFPHTGSKMQDCDPQQNPVDMLRYTGAYVHIASIHSENLS